MVSWGLSMCGGVLFLPLVLLLVHTTDFYYFSEQYILPYLSFVSSLHVSSYLL